MEVETVRPDVVLFQESPSRDKLRKVGDSLFGDEASVLWGPDTSIVARRQLEPVAVPAEFRENFVHALLEADGATVNVISLRLFPCPVRLDLWRPRCWQVYRKDRQARRRQLETIARYVATIPDDEPIIFGGDFNAPAGDAVFRLLESRLADSFLAAGRGWGNTFMSGLPVLRIDQIWISRHVRPIAAYARGTQHWDHRMAVAELSLRSQNGSE
jgi:endonuclease/exonuclease/phosphatase (EEP) superfamily protein YafD